MATKLCPTCGKHFNIKPSLSNQICCTIKCKKIYTQQLNTKQCAQCNKDYVSNNKQSKFCSPKCRTDSSKILTNVFNCRECGKQFKERSRSRDNNIFCSRECSFKNMHDNKLSNILTKEEMISRQRNIYKQKRLRNKKTFSIMHHLNCKECGLIFISRYKNTKNCSNKCQLDSYKPILYKQCTICNKEYITKSQSKNQCSEECKQKHKNKLIYNKRKKNRHLRKHINRAKKFNVNYDIHTTLLNIRIRDGIKCLLCGKKVLKVNQSGFNKDNATVGHIVALSKGGSHTMQNVQLECMECNMRKGTNTLGQLRLF